MGTRETAAETVYAAAASWMERGLRDDDSLFTPGRPIWTDQSLGELRERFLDRPDESKQSFLDKLERQLAGAPPAVIQLMAEVLYVHFLVVLTSDSGNEQRQLRRVLSWSRDPVSIPPELVEGLTPGLVNPGQGFHSYRPFQVAEIIEFAEEWKRMPPSQQDRLLADPWAFKDFLMALEPRSEMLRGFPNRGRAQRQALLHLLHPDTFEPIVSINHKEMIARRFDGLLGERPDDIDRAIQQIRSALEANHGSDEFDFYWPDVRRDWDPDFERKGRNQSADTENGSGHVGRLETASGNVGGASGGPQESAGPTTLAELAGQLSLPLEFLEDVEQLLEDKRQVIFQGPPGTGKTYVALQLARYLAGATRRVTLVQFHPSYAYEDFVQGYRPALDEGRPTFKLSSGALLLAAEAARAEQVEGDPEVKHFLVIDEINRGNLAKVFGELYFLLEYRNEAIRLQYSGDSGALFSLPKNLYIIGTMNTADRSIALVDLALRRRFHFVEFHPAEWPIEGLLRRWLDAHGLDEMGWVADIVDLANEQLGDDRHAAIGPSHFMNPELSAEVVERTWRHSVMPYLKERLFASAERLAEFELSTLRRKAERRAASEGDDSTLDESIPADSGSAE